ncbi:liver carboxylesterase 1 isoform X2 [Eurytemora carolleeae]|uniref:liver carboxylesterase 1 isoform X2 n=1 Tax=Eurytemora carolleeae TaxID=1294199 RepID=UPI000C792C37|nr:liver carboxylesterase 1 isoform X2 [Eurytemora carolleeae]|eukprot:XP_023321978.1 liver carboxylesterase 1-like isoform X2 [Eurytemora affinis]
MKLIVVLSLIYTNYAYPQGFEDAILKLSLKDTLVVPPYNQPTWRSSHQPYQPPVLRPIYQPPALRPSYLPPTPKPAVTKNRLLGTFVSLSGSLLGIAGQVAKHAGNFIYNSGHLVRASGEMLSHVGVAVEHGGAVLNSAGLVARHSGDLIHQDSGFARNAQRGLVCALICPIRQGDDQRVCESENCSVQVQDEIQEYGQGRIGELRSSQEDSTFLGFGANILVSGSRMISDIAFVKLRLLQGLFSTPDCSNEDVNEVGCISAYCLLPDDERRKYSDEDSCKLDLEETDFLISTALGPVIGKKETFRDERFETDVKYLSFTGIPYAEPPTGSYRYSYPRSVSSWECPLDATRLKNKMCPQISIGVDHEGLVPGTDEDCLYLNVYVPQPQGFNGINREKLRPVLVYIHGGAFMFGSGSACWYGPEFWMIHDIIVVTFNYRLGPLGFLSLGSKDIPGNAGMLDQVEALKWIQDNIRSYGGDPGQVTLMGQSAGSFSATYHLVSPLSRGLFKRIIAHSGVGGFSPSYHQYSPEQAVKFGAKSAALIGCTDVDSQLSCLRKKPVSEIMSMDVRNEFLSQPVVDGNFSDSPFLPAEPKDLIKLGKYDRDVDVLLGFNRQEGLMVTSLFKDYPLLYTAMAASWPVLGPFSLLGRHHSEITERDKEIANEILSFYVGNVTDIGPDKLDNITDMYTDSFFSYGVHNFLHHHLKHTRGNTYQFVYSYEGEMGPGHSAEIPLFWATHKGKLWLKSAQELELSRQLTTIWSNFVKTGTPRNPRVNKPYHASVHPVYRSPRTSLQGKGEEEEEKTKPKSILNTDFNWTNLAKKAELDKILRISTLDIEDFLKVDRNLRLEPELPEVPEFLEISQNLRMRKSANWEKRMRFWETILPNI